MNINVGFRPDAESDVLSHPLEGMMIAPPPALREEMGFFTDSTL